MVIGKCELLIVGIGEKKKLTFHHQLSVHLILADRIGDATDVSPGVAGNHLVEDEHPSLLADRYGVVGEGPRLGCGTMPPVRRHGVTLGDAWQGGTVAHGDGHPVQATRHSGWLVVVRFWKEKILINFLFHCLEKLMTISRKKN